MGIGNKMMKAARTFILVVMIGAVAAGILTMWIYTQPGFIEQLVEGNFWFLFSVFTTCWLMASIISWVCITCATRTPSGGVAGELAGSSMGTQ